MLVGVNVRVGPAVDKFVAIGVLVDVAIGVLVDIGIAVDVLLGSGEFTDIIVAERSVGVGTGWGARHATRSSMVTIKLIICRNILL